MPTNLYGPNDNYDLNSSHVLPAMIRKFHEAKENGHTQVELWGTGGPMREFLHVDDLAQAVLFAQENTLEESLYNVGTGKDLTIKELAELIQAVVGHEGKTIWDRTKPDGTPRKLLSVQKISKLGWTSQIELSQGIKQTYKSYLQNERK
jgi:GDP-L-fucose synthase